LQGFGVEDAVAGIFVGLGAVGSSASLESFSAAGVVGDEGSDVVDWIEFD